MDQLRPNSDPNFGEVSLTEGFDSDPYTLRVSGGGSIHVSSLQLCEYCEGYTSLAPDFRLKWTGNTENLRVFFEANDPSEDATMIIRTSDGTWIGNDDWGTNTMDPMIHLSGLEGSYFDIWVGSYSSGTIIEGTLTITESSNVLSTTDTGTLDPSHQPHFGTVSLSSGFSDDPHQIRITGGGMVNVGVQDLCPDCTGYASIAPDIRLYWDGDSDDFRIYFESEISDQDATLIISTPNGDWIGNDDAHGNTMNPMVSLSGHGPGQYDIWVGSFSRDEAIKGAITITESDSTP